MTSQQPHADVPAAGSVSWDTGIGAGASQLVTGLADLDLEPDSIRAWLTEFGQMIFDLDLQRHWLEAIANRAASVQLGEMDFSSAIRSRLAERLGSSDGGLAWAADNVVRELARIHEALRLALATHLGADLDAERIIHRIGQEPTG